VEAATKAPITSTYTATSTAGINPSTNTIPAVSSVIQSGNNNYTAYTSNYNVNNNLDDEKVKKSNAIETPSTNTAYAASYANNYLDNVTNLTSVAANQQQQQQ